MALPTPSAIGPSIRYIPAGIERIVFCSTIASKGAPTSAEISAGTELTGEVFQRTGFALTGVASPAPDLGSKITSEIAGRRASSGNALEMYASQNSTDVRSLLPALTVGFIVIFPEGIVTGNKCSVWPVTVITSMPTADIEANSTFTVQFAMTSAPAENIAVPIA